MAPAPSIFLLLLTLLLLLTNAAHTRETPPPTPQRIIAPPPPDNQNDTSSPFRPGIAVVVCVLTTIISLTSLLLLYIKHCNGGNIHSGGSSIPWTVAPFSGRKNSGLVEARVEARVVVAGGATRLRWLVEARVEARVVVAGGSRGGRRLTWSPEFAEEKWQLRARGRRGSVFEP
ncbi:hypothetical protein DEO72_LG5g1211 [Vigna unguiculata]|uniref:Uncharacterized protein n=1 Tax=Vigna unguiculata TaxID=3917 RepID=A0A4D6LXD3_VIGUN|nr:hypothetical protein DEO72_LG5g1211 [Vigna unguiculata]